MKPELVRQLEIVINSYKKEYGEHIPPSPSRHTTIKAHRIKPESEGFKDYSSLPRSWYECEVCGTHCSQFSTKQCPTTNIPNVGWEVMLKGAIETVKIND